MAYDSVTHPTIQPSVNVWRVSVCVCVCVVVYGGRETLNALRSLTYYMKTVFARSVCCCYIQSHIIHCNATLIFRQMSVAVLLFALSSSMLHVARPTLAKRFIIIIIESERASPWDETEKTQTEPEQQHFISAGWWFFLSFFVEFGCWRSIYCTHTSCAHKSSRAMLTIQYCRVVSADKQDRHTSYYYFCCSNIDEQRERAKKQYTDKVRLWDRSVRKIASEHSAQWFLLCSQLNSGFFFNSDVNPCHALFNYCVYRFLKLKHGKNKNRNAKYYDAINERSIANACIRFIDSVSNYMVSIKRR